MSRALVTVLPVQRAKVDDIEGMSLHDIERIAIGLVCECEISVSLDNWSGTAAAYVGYGSRRRALSHWAGQDSDLRPYFDLANRVVVIPFEHEFPQSVRQQYSDKELGAMSERLTERWAGTFLQNCGISSVSKLNINEVGANTGITLSSSGNLHTYAIFLDNQEPGDRQRGEGKINNKTATGTTLYQLGTSAYHNGTSAFHSGTSAHHTGTSAWDLGTDVFTLGLREQHSRSGQPGKRSRKDNTWSPIKRGTGNQVWLERAMEHFKKKPTSAQLRSRKRGPNGGFGLSALRAQYVLDNWPPESEEEVAGAGQGSSSSLSSSAASSSRPKKKNKKSTTGPMDMFLSRP